MIGEAVRWAPELIARTDVRFYDRVDVLLPAIKESWSVYLHHPPLRDPWGRAQAVPSPETYNRLALKENPLVWFGLSAGDRLRLPPDLLERGAQLDAKAREAGMVRTARVGTEAQLDELAKNARELNDRAAILADPRPLAVFVVPRAAGGSETGLGMNELMKTHRVVYREVDTPAEAAEALEHATRHKPAALVTLDMFSQHGAGFASFLKRPRGTALTEDMSDYLHASNVKELGRLFQAAKLNPDSVVVVATAFAAASRETPGDPNLHQLVHELFAKRVTVEAQNGMGDPVTYKYAPPIGPLITWDAKSRQVFPGFDSRTRVTLPPEG